MATVCFQNGLCDARPSNQFPHLSRSGWLSRALSSSQNDGIPSLADDSLKDPSPPSPPNSRPSVACKCINLPSSQPQLQHWFKESGVMRIRVEQGLNWVSVANHSRSLVHPTCPLSCGLLEEEEYACWLPRGRHNHRLLDGKPDPCACSCSMVSGCAHEPGSCRVRLWGVVDLLKHIYIYLVCPPGLFHSQITSSQTF